MDIEIDRERARLTPPEGWVVCNSPGSDVFLSPDSFVTGSVSARSLAPVPAPGNVYFTVRTNYAHPASVGTWVYRISVDNVVKARWDGGAHKRPVRVSIKGLRAGSVVRLEVAALRDKPGLASWSEATRASICEVQFVETEATRCGVVVGIDPSDRTYLPDTANSVFVLDAAEIATWPAHRLEADTPQRLDVVTDRGVLPLLVVRRPGAARTVILSNGAVDLERSGGEPVFQRSSWHTEIQGHLIYVCDPGTVGPGALPLAWGQISARHWVVPDMAAVVRAVSRRLGVVSGAGRLYYGSSAGGFLSLGMAASDNGCRVIINNAQFDWTRWMAGGVNALRAARFENALPATIRSRNPRRTNILNNLAPGRGPRTVDYLVNLDSNHDREVDARIMGQCLLNHPEFRDMVRAIAYRDPVAGHNPLPKNLTLPWLHSPTRVPPQSIDTRFDEAPENTGIQGLW